MDFKRVVSLLAVLLVGALLAGAAPRTKERASTDPDRDLTRVTIKGTVEDITGQRAIIKTEEGKKVTVHLGPRWYWREKGYSLKTGARVTVEGWGEKDDGDLFAGSIYGDGFSIELWTSDGYPRWMDWDKWYDDWRPCRSIIVFHWGPPWRPWWGPPPRWWGWRYCHDHCRWDDCCPPYPRYGPRWRRY